MSTTYEVRAEYDWYTAYTTSLTVWEGGMFSTWTATAERVRNGARTFTLHTYAGDEPHNRVRVRLPEGITMPRTDQNYEQIDAAISDALNAWEKARDSIQSGAL